MVNNSLFKPRTSHHCRSKSYVHRQIHALVFAAQKEKAAVSCEKSHGDIWDTFNSDAYINHNYLTRVLPEDETMMRGMIASLKTLKVPPYSQDVVADIGNGGVFHYSGILQHLVAPGGHIEYTEYSPHGLHVARRTLNAYKRTGDLREWQKFGDKVVEIDEKYGIGPHGEPIHPAARAFRLGRVTPGNVYSLRPNAYSAAGAFYCLESISSEEVDWNNATESFVNSVRPGGVVIVASMKLSEGYTTPDPTGKTIFPAYPVDTNIVASRLEELGVRDIQTAEALDENHGFRPADGPQYKGVCLAIGIRAIVN